MVDRPEDYKWSSYGCNAEGVIDEIVVGHPAFMALGREKKERCEAYRELFQVNIDPEMIASIRGCVKDGGVLGSVRFKNEVDSAIAQRVGLGS